MTKNEKPHWLTEEDHVRYFVAHGSKRVSKNKADPVVHNSEELYFFCDETWAHMFGPFSTEKECREELKIYTTTI